MSARPPGVGARLHADRIPISDETRKVAGALGLDPLTWALHGGEDFELCLTAPPDAAASLEQGFRKRFDCPLTRIGTIQTGAGVTLCHSDGGEVPLIAGGYDHFHEQGCWHGVVRSLTWRPWSHRVASGVIDAPENPERGGGSPPVKDRKAGSPGGRI